MCWASFTLTKNGAIGTLAVLNQTRSNYTQPNFYKLK